MDSETIKLICLIGACFFVLLTLRESWLTTRLYKKTFKVISEIETMQKFKSE